jgi:curved DNA-binding protein CbpA
VAATGGLRPPHEKEAKPAAPASPALRVDDLPAVDAALGLDAKVQEQILAFARGLSRPYHEILGVAANADARAIKKAYFSLSKLLHPDRYFRTETGAFAPVIERCFKKLLEAYELLSDPATRAEVQRAPEAAEAPSAPAGTALTAAEARRRLRERVGQVSGPARAAGERKRKAKAFFESGMTAFAAERWLEAAGSVRLAIAFDPQNEAYRERFVDVQRRAHDERAKVAQKQGESALEMRDYEAALRCFEEAVDYRPLDSELAHRAAKIAWQALGDLKKAKELASQAVGLAPDNGDYRRTLGLVYKAAGLPANARRELEAALRIDPRDKEAKDGLRGL